MDRARPAVLPAIGRALTPSFPSAHSAGTAAIVGMTAVIVAGGPPAGATRRAVYLSAAAAVLLIGFSRLFLNLHFLSDVVGGYLVALFWLAIGSGLVARDAPPNRMTSFK